MIASSKIEKVQNFSNIIANKTYLFILKDLGLSANENRHVRGECRQSKSEMVVIKNRLAKISFKNNDLDSASDFLKDKCMIVLSNNPVETATALNKLIVAYSKKLKFIGMSASKNDLIEQGMHFSLKELRNIMTLDSARATLVFTLKNILVKMVHTIKAIKKEKTT